jgi:hypothetical protein
MIISRAEPETIDRECPVQINRIFGSKKNLFFTIRPLFFSEPRGARAPVGAYLRSAPDNKCAEMLPHNPLIDQTNVIGTDATLIYQLRFCVVGDSMKLE